MAKPTEPRWVREIDRYLGIKTQFYLHGNIHDRVCYQQQEAETGNTRFRLLTLHDFLASLFAERGYELIGFYDILDGFSFTDPAMQPRFLSLLPKDDGNRGGTGKDPLQQFRFSAGTQGAVLQAIHAIRSIVQNDQVSSVFVIEHASSLLGSPQQLSTYEHLYFLGLLKCAADAARAGTGKDVKDNLTAIVCNKLNDLPAWLYLSNPLGRSVRIDSPDEDERRFFLNSTWKNFYKADDPEVKPTENLEAFVDFTQGLSNVELSSLRTLSRREEIPFGKPQEIVERYKFGKIESKWNKLDPERLAKAGEILGKRVIGQNAAIRAVTDILMRAKMGLSGIQHSARSNKPKGVLFFAGPTGVGKTEMAKALAELLFHDEKACIRFDMSEYSQEHSDQKLLGAPPGYVGYEEGGQLTNKVKENPFCVLLFDEIEKASRNILDKFLQILEDGRMTDGKGETVYFSETLIIFTSNLGTVEELPTGERRPLTNAQMPREEVQKKILDAIEKHFKFTLGRPEIFNRFGNNFVVFDYIREEVMGKIIDKVLGNIVKDTKERLHVELKIAPAVKKYLFDEAVKNLEMGGRGAGNLIETRLVNPLARKLFEYGEKLPAQLTIASIQETTEDNATVYALQTT